MKETIDQNQVFTTDNSERQPCEVWTRVMGYHRPVTSFNAGKRAEHRQRRFFRVTGDCKRTC